MNYIIRQRVWLIFIFFQKYGQEVGRQKMRQDQHEHLTQDEPLWMKSLHMKHFHHCGCLNGKRGATPHRFSFTLLTLSISLPDFLLHLRVDSWATILFSHRLLPQWIERCDFGATCTNIIKRCVKVLSVIRVSTRHKGENSILIFFSLGLQFLPQDILKWMML